MPKGISFSGEFKQKVIEDMHSNKLSYREIAKKVWTFKSRTSKEMGTHLSYRWY